MKSAEIYKNFVSAFDKRKFSAGLLIAFIDFYLELGIPELKAKGLDDVLAKFPKQEKTSAGHTANTLIVALPKGGTLSLRPFYNQVETFFRAEHKRFDYPSCAPHATQAWHDYKPWLDGLAKMSRKELLALRTKVADYVLETLKDQSFDPSMARTEPALFRALLESFDITAQKNEPSGAAFQGIVFGFLRADNPHLQIEIDKVRTGSKRLQRVGDIDGWEGAQLALSAEVKQFELKPENVSDLEGFANATSVRGALAIVAALGFKGDTRAQIEALGPKCLDTNDLLRIVELWDPLKQRTAASSLVYYAKHVEKNSSLSARIEEFLKAAATPKL